MIIRGMIISVYDAVPGMWLSDDVFTPDGIKLIRRGTQLTKQHIHYLRRYKIKEIQVMRDDPSLEESPNWAGDLNEQIPNDYQKYVILVREDANKFFQEAIHSLIRGKDRRTKQMMTSIKELMGRLLDDPTILEYLFKIRAIGDGSLHHGVQVMVLSTAIAIQLNLDVGAVEEIATASLLFDIGKSCIDRSILFKRGPLSVEEFEIVKKHTDLGYQMLQRDFAESIALVALQHHERYNGSGYPQGLKNDAIHLFSRIISVADVFVSLINQRVYRHRYQPHEAIEYMYGAGGHLFDPIVVAAFLNVVSLYQVGTIVELSNGWVGVVKEVENQPIGRPIIEIIMDEKRRPMTKMVDLREECRLTIERVLDP